MRYNVIFFWLCYLVAGARVCGKAKNEYGVTKMIFLDGSSGTVQSVDDRWAGCQSVFPG